METPAEHSTDDLIAENLELRARLEEAEDALRAIREGEVDAVIVSGSKGDRVFSLTETENLHRLMVETMNEAGLAVSADGLLLYVNDRAAALLERGRSGLLGHPIEELVAPTEVAGLRRLLNASQDGTADDRIVFRSVSGAEVPMHLWASRLPRPGEAMICLVGTDLTRLEADRAILNQLRQHQEALKASRAEALELLSQALVAREQAAQLAQELRESDRRKDAFLATLAHELRNPLVPICNALEILRLQNAGTRADAEAREMMERYLGHLVRLVDDLMDVSRITHGKVNLVKERLDLASVIDSAVEMVHPILQTAGQRLQVELPPSQSLWLDGDPTRLIQIFGNLLNNAIKYTQAGQIIRISAHRLTRDEVKVSVEDSGSGIPAEILPRVFDMFAQGHGTPTEHDGGLGIGLTLVRTLVQLHGGRVEAFSAGPGQGTKIQVYLPLAVDETCGTALPMQSQAESASIFSKRRILVVDDNRDAASSLARALELKGAQVRVAYNGHSALSALEEELAEILILDIGMPGLDGHEVAVRIRSRADWNAIRLIAMTGLGDASARRRSAEVGFDHHLVKPVSFELLEQAVASAAAREALTAETAPERTQWALQPLRAACERTPEAPATPLGNQLPDALAGSLLHDLAQPLSSARCYAMAARALASQAGLDIPSLHEALKGVEEQVEVASRIMELLRGTRANPAHSLGGSTSVSGSQERTEPGIISGIQAPR
ncbi:MAG: ATP-binding protein [Lamprobacter sp.]|uniref:hybrid sensor histidine kinase/response regulator n=1 Tax=Lamprobacter sp. TaxID=3100796 RepID=UPI002B25D5AC|nr:ATP-binding protein [Lamprobacter sp.]MEA3641456.1 ATP-binding protein [Lamprobacter sp.]